MLELLKISDKRMQEMHQGAIELEEWLLDTIRQGLASLEGRHDAFWEELASRMVNAKLGGIGNEIRRFKNLSIQANWHELILNKIAHLYLFSKAFQKIDQLSISMKVDLLQKGGVNVDQKLLINKPGIKDKWLVVSQHFGKEEQLNFRKTYMYGEKSGKLALILDYEWGHTNFKPEYKLGYIYNAEIIYFPASVPLRALSKEPVSSREGFQGKGGYNRINILLDQFADFLTANPFISSFPFLLNEVKPTFDGQPYLIDSLNYRLPVKHSNESFWKLLALSEGKPLSLIGDWNGICFSPISVFAMDRIVSLEKSV